MATVGTTPVCDICGEAIRLWIMSENTVRLPNGEVLDVCGLVCREKAELESEDEHGE